MENGGENGVLMPPPELQGVIEKTAQAVWRSKDRNTLVQKILSGATAAACSFLRSTDPHHGYYKQVLNKLDAQKRAAEESQKQAEAVAAPAAEAEPAPGPEPPERKPAPVPGVVPGAETTEKAAEISKSRAAEAKAQAARPVPTEPPPEEIFTPAIPLPAPSAQDLAVIQLTAQFAACCGRPFLAGVNVREYRNPQFAFLKPENPHFALFQEYVKVYKMVTEPEDKVTERMKKLGESKAAIYDEVLYRLDWEDLQTRENSKDADEERLQMQLIDWHDFILVETIELDEEDDSLPVPVAPEQARLSVQQDAAIPAKASKPLSVPFPEVADDENEMEMEIDDDGAEDASVSVADTSADIPANLIRKDYVPKFGAANQRREISAVLPSGQTVPMNEASASMKVELLDPKYKEERQRAADKNRLQNLASDDEIARNLGRRNTQKTEVFGRVDLQEALHTKKIDVPNPPSSTLQNAPAPKPVEVPKAPTQPPTGATLGAAPYVMPYANAASNAPAAPPEKKAKLDENAKESGTAALVPEEEWLASQSETVRVHIKAPTHTSKEWELQGQTISLEAPLKAAVGALKKTIQKHTKLPYNKQKLQIAKLGFLKDSLSLAHYNVKKDTIIVLEVKERGGKKK